MFKFKSKIIIIFIIIPMLLLTCPSVAVAAEDAQPISYLALGDSIAKGYSCDETVITAYPELVSRQLELDTGSTVELDNLAKNGLSTVRFNASMLGESEVREKIRQADIITVTIGANDLIDEFKRASQEVLGRTEKFWNISDAMEMLNTEMKSHPMLVLKAIGVIASWDYESFEESYCEMMDGITKGTAGSVKIIVTDIYNPITGLDMPVTLDKVVGSIIGKMNNIIEGHASEYGYQVIKLTDEGISEYVQSDGLHPTQEGQQLIAEAVQKKLTVLAEEPGEAEAEAAPKSGSVRVWNLMPIAGTCVTGVLLVVLGLWKGKRREEKDEDITGGN